MSPPLVDGFCHSVSRWVPAHFLYPCVILFVDIPSYLYTIITVYQDQFCCFVCIHANKKIPIGPGAIIIYSLVLQICMLSIFHQKNPKNQDTKEFILVPSYFSIFIHLTPRHIQTFFKQGFEPRASHMLGNCLTSKPYSLFSHLSILIATLIIY